MEIDLTDRHAMHAKGHCNYCGEDFCKECDPEHLPNCREAMRP